MWFLFGVLTLLISVVVSYSGRRSASWTPDHQERNYEYKLATVKKQVVGFLFGTSGVPNFDFTIKKETRLDRYFKRLGISNEIQTGDTEFDDLVYVLSDNSSLHKKLTQSESFRDAVKAIFQFGLNKRFDVAKLECRNGRLWVKCSTKDPISELNVAGVVVNHLLPKLFIIKKELNQLDKTNYNRWSDPFSYKSIIVLALSSGVAVNAGVQLFRGWFGDFPFIVNLLPFILHAVFAGVLAALSLAVFTLWWLKNSSRTHIVLIELITIGLIGFIGSAFYMLRDINMEWQQSEPKIIVTELRDHYTIEKVRWSGRYKRERMTTTHYYLLLKDWNCQCDKTYKKEVSSDVYRRLNYYQYIGVVQHSGALGYAWVSDLKPANYSQIR